MSDANSLWGPIDAQNWKSVQFLTERVAEEHDVKDGRAVFYLKDAATFPTAFPMPLPRCAWLKVNERKKPVVLIQAEKTADVIYVGYRDLTGGNGICLINEVEFVDRPDALFWA